MVGETPLFYLSKMASKNRTHSYTPLVDVLNHDIDGIIRWCTPSIHPKVPKINGIYTNDISISYHKIGNPSMDTGVFHQAHKLAAKAYKADYTLFSVNGSTGSNFMVLRALKHQLGKVKMLAQRNVHKSISCAIEDYRIDVTYLKPHYDNTLQIFVPNTIEEIIEGLKKDPTIKLLFLSLPTYEGLSIDLKQLVKKVRRYNNNIIIFIDEAWGAHFPFSTKLPTCAMDAGADVCVQSTHKQGSGLQQTSMIHWQGTRMKRKYMLDSYQALLTTSPSFHLLASIDAARYLMETQGKEVIDDLLEVSNILREGLQKIPGVRVISEDYIIAHHKQVTAIDKSKVLVNVAETGISGFELAHYLEEKYKVIVEKYEANNILFLTTFQNSQFEAKQTIRYVTEAVHSLQKIKKHLKKVVFPDFPEDILKERSSYTINGYGFISEDINKSIGKVCAEYVVPYPPGVPLLAKGEVIQKEHVKYLNALKNYKDLTYVMMNDKGMNKIVVAR